MRRFSLILICIIVLLAGLPLRSANLRLPGHNNPPPARPHRRSGGEGFPPLPLPVTPLRRSEKKREPAPPILVAKIEYVRGFYNITSDVRRLLIWAKKQVNLSYRPVTIPFTRFKFNPTEVPIMYLTGHDPLPKPSEREITLIRDYVLSGGTIVANACCGDPTFTKSFRKFIKRVFPEKSLHRLNYEHPIFHCYYDIEDVHFQKGTNQFFIDEPILEGINIGCRTAVIFAPADLSNGWYGQNPPRNFPPGFWVLKEDARKLGMNIVSYILGNLLYARTFPLIQVQYKTVEGESSGEPFVFAQLIHQGDWNPNPSAIQRLQKYLAQNSTLNIQFKQKILLPDDIHIFDYPMVYMVGHRNFAFTEDEVKTLRKYLLQGGVLFAESCCGRREFDLAFRREIKRVLPEYRLKVLPANHPIYSVNYKIDTVHLTPLAKEILSDSNRPWLEAIEIDGRIAVIYSPLAISNGWEGIEHPFSAGYEETDSLRLGINIILYIMTH